MMISHAPLRTGAPAPGVRARRRVRRGHHGQTTIEFSFAFILLLFGVFGSITSAVWAIEAMGAISAEETALRTTSGASGAGAAANTANVSAAVLAPIAKQLQSSMFGTRVFTQVGSCGSLTVPSSAQVTVCAETAGGYVTVRVVGCAATLVPKTFGLGGCADGVAIDQWARVHALVFTT